MHLTERFTSWLKSQPKLCKPPSEKSTSAIHFCKICFKDITNYPWSSLTEYPVICDKCFSEMRPKETTFKVGKFRARAFYEYNEKIRSLLYQFKACKDIELSSVFFAKQASFLKMAYQGYTLVPAPSYQGKDDERGFNHVKEMFKCLELSLLDPLIKIHDVKQADGNYEERLNIFRHISFRDDISVKGLKILFVDDLVTTGSTAKACCELLSEHGASSIQILVMGHAILKHDKKEP